MYHFIALFSGFLLGCMIFFNGALAAVIGPVPGSFIVHAAGLALSFLLILKIREKPVKPLPPAPRWAYFGGAFGGILVVITGVTVNSEIGVAGTVAMVLVGQVLLGMVTDHFGHFGLARRPLSARDVIQITLVLAGSGLLLNA